MNEMSTSPGNTYTYDNAGNMISDNNGTTITTYTYDYENRLTNVTTGGTVVATYTYNALGQRIGVKDSGTQTWTVYDGPSADANPYADFNGSGSLTVRYLFGPTVVNGAVTTGILARTSSGGTTAWYLTDKLGSVRDIVEHVGNGARSHRLRQLRQHRHRDEREQWGSVQVRGDAVRCDDGAILRPRAIL